MNALERLRRRTRRLESDHAVQAPFTVDGCECLIDGDFALLRVAGTGHASPVALIAGLEAFEPLPQPGGDSDAGVWRIAFAVPSDVADGSQDLWLLDGEAYRAELILPGAAPKAREVEPEPAHEEPSIDELAAAAAPLVEAVKDVAPPVEASKPAAPSPEELDDPRARKLVEAWSEANHLRERLTEREHELGEALKELLDARNEVQPLRDRADALTSELATLNEDLKGSRQATKEARLRATQKAAELDAVRTELEAAQPRVEKAERARDRAEQEATQLRDQVKQLEVELAQARAEVQDAIAHSEGKLQDVLDESKAARERIDQERAEAEAERDRLAGEAQAERERLAEEAKAERDRALAEAEAELTRVQEEAQAERNRLEEQEKEAEKLRAEIEKLESGNSRRRGFGRRANDSELAKVRAELEERILTQQQRIAELEHDATSFAERAEGAVADSLKERVAKLESDLDQTKATADDLRALLDSERELVAAARREAQDLRRQLAAAKANREAPAEEQPIVAKRTPVPDDSDAAGPDSPPWSALDEELLARIEKAKALTS